jgi:hypothetical protein
VSPVETDTVVVRSGTAAPGTPAMNRPNPVTTPQVRRASAASNGHRTDSRRGSAQDGETTGWRPATTRARDGGRSGSARLPRTTRTGRATPAGTGPGELGRTSPRSARIDIGTSSQVLLLSGPALLLDGAQFDRPGPHPATKIEQAFYRTPVRMCTTSHRQKSSDTACPSNRCLKSSSRRANVVDQGVCWADAAGAVGGEIVRTGRTGRVDPGDRTFWEATQEMKERHGG